MTMKNENSHKAGAACGKTQAKAPEKKDVKAESKPSKGAKK
jgi:hypothetical protein